MKTYCPFCGIANVPEVSVCRACGTALPKETTSAQSAPPINSSSQMYAAAPPDNSAQQWAGSQPAPVDDRRAGPPNGYHGQPIPVPDGRSAPFSPSFNRLQPGGPYNGSYPAQYVPVAPQSGQPPAGQYQPSAPAHPTYPAQTPAPPPYYGTPPSGMYLPGDPRAYTPVSPAPLSPAQVSAYYSAQASQAMAPAPQPYLPVPAGQFRLADTGTRLGAFVLDSVALTVPWFMLMGVAAATTSEAVAGLATLAMLLGPALYFVICWANGGQTLGYRALGLKLVRTDGSEPGVGSAIARCIGIFMCLFMLIPGMFGLLWMLWDDRKQGLHDKMGDTLVVKR